VPQQSLTASTRDKAGLLREFDESPDDEIFVLASCRAISEGVDTRFADMVVLASPKASWADTVQVSWLVGWLAQEGAAPGDQACQEAACALGCCA
jgi:predicted helicase